MEGREPPCPRAQGTRRRPRRRTARRAREGRPGSRTRPAPRTLTSWPTAALARDKVAPAEGGRSMQGLMQDVPLSLVQAFGRAERLFADKPVVAATPAGVQRTTYGEWAVRTRRLAGALDALGISEDGRVGTFAWNTARHLELYFGAPCSGRVLHTLNIRLFPEQVTYIANHAADEVVFVDRSLLPIFWPLVETLETVRHIVVMDDGADAAIPDDPRVADYDDLLASADPVAEWRIDDENRAAAMCYTSGTTGNPKGVVY